MQDGPAHSAGVEEDWYARAFDALYPVVYAHRTVEAAAPEAAFALDALRVSPQDRLLDLCCGNGRHLVHLARRAPHAAGLDYSPDLLRLARENLGGAVSLVRGDMRSLPFSAAFDVVTNFFTSFGYFLDEGENRMVAAELARVLRPGGRFLVDYLNADHVADTLAPASERESQGHVIRERRWIDTVLGRVNKTMEVSRDGAVISRSSESVRLYSERELVAMLASAGLEVTATHGNHDGDPVDASRPRVILVGRKPVEHG